MDNNSEKTCEKFYQYYKSFLQDIMIAFPEYKESIIEKHSSLLKVNYPISETKRKKCDRWRKIVFEFILNNGTHISNKDPKIFLLPECKTCLGRNIDFEEIWNSKISQTSREQLWNYLQTFYMLAVSETTNNDLSTLFKNFENVFKTTENSKEGETKEEINEEMLNNLRSITENMVKSMENDNQELPEETLEEINNQTDKIKQEFDGIFENSMIGDLANDIAKDINIDDMVGNANNPQDLIGSLFGGGEGGGPNIMSIVENIGKNINQKVESGQLDEMKLVNEAHNLMGNLQNNPFFSGLTQGLNAAMQPQARNPTQERLQKKLKQRKQQNNK